MDIGRIEFEDRTVRRLWPPNIGGTPPVGSNTAEQPKVKPIGYLEPGKIYVVIGLFKSQEAKEAFRADLHRQIPECKFLVINGPCEFLTTIPVADQPI